MFEECLETGVGHYRMRKTDKRYAYTKANFEGVAAN